MNKYLRPLPFPLGSPQRRRCIDHMMAYAHISYREAVAKVVAANKVARDTPLRGERCGARTRRATSCMCKAMANGRCKYHGGMSTGPKTEEGRRNAMANLKPFAPVRHEVRETECC